MKNYIIYDDKPDGWRFEVSAENETTARDWVYQHVIENGMVGATRAWVDSLTCEEV